MQSQPRRRPLEPFNSTPWLQSGLSSGIFPVHSLVLWPHLLTLPTGFLCDASGKENQFSSRKAGTKLLFPFFPNRVHSWEGKTPPMLMVCKDRENIRRVSECGNISDCESLWGVMHSVLPLNRDESKPEITHSTLTHQSWPQQTSLVWPT